MLGRPIHRARSCLRPFHSSAHAQHCAYSTKVLRGDALGPIEQDDHQTYRLRKGGQKLPLPPSLDPIVVEQKTRWTQQKARPDVNSLTPFQKKLYENPYAHALASPPRIDRSSNALIPSAFLLTLNPTQHPTENSLWLLPLSLTANSKKHNGLAFRFVAHKYIARYLAPKRLWQRAMSKRFIDKFSAAQRAAMVWREDLAELIQKLLQDRVVDKLAWWFKWRGRLVPVASPRAEDIDSVDDVSCVLMLGSAKTRADDMLEEVHKIVAEADKWSVYFAKGFPRYFDVHLQKNVTHSAPVWYEPIVPRLAARARFPPLGFPTTVWRGKKVAVYSLTDMLGEEKAKELVNGTHLEEQRCFVMRRGRQNVPTELLLMQLQSYLAVPGPYWSPKERYPRS